MELGRRRRWSAADKLLLAHVAVLVAAIVIVLQVLT